MKGVSYYKNRLQDAEALYLEKGAFGIVGDGQTDDTKAIQAAIEQVWREDGLGIVFLPEGEYLVTDTIYMPKAVRLIGYGEKRPVIRLKDRAEGFTQEHPQDRFGCKYVFWFTDNVPDEENGLRDANPGTFYSSIMNVDVDMGEGNIFGCAFRTHYAQHSFIAHIDVRVGDSYAAICDCGNVMEDIAIYGGTYGIVSTRCSPGWPFVMMDIYMEGQKRAAIYSQELGLAAVRTTVKNTPVFMKVRDGYIERLILEDSCLENVTEAIVDIGEETCSHTQLHIRNTVCANVPVVARYRTTKKEIRGGEGSYCIRSFVHGIVMDNLDSTKRMEESIVIEPAAIVEAPATDIPVLYPMEDWVNVKDFGAIGDGIHDDTQALKSAMEGAKAIYMPQGKYLVTDTICLKRDTMLVGLHPMATQILLPENAENYTGFGPEKPVVMTEAGGTTVLSGIGIDAGGRNPRAAALLWQGGEHSYLNDVKFIGGHGTMEKGHHGWITPYNESRTADASPVKKWDGQYPSLHVTGGGVFVNLWSASPYASAGLFAENTKVKTSIYCISIEHHVRREALLKNVANWRIYGFQTEEEKAESVYAIPLEMIDCENVSIETAYMFRTVYVNTPSKYAIHATGCKNTEILNAYNYAQMRYAFDNLCYEPNTGREVRPWQLARLGVESGVRKDKTQLVKEAPLYEPVELYREFRTVDGACSNSRGDVFFLDSADKKIYKIDGATGRLSLICETPFKPNALLTDTEDNLVVAGEYSIPIGATMNGEKLVNVLPEDSYGTSYGFWYDRNAYVVVYTIKEQEGLGAIVPIEKECFAELQGIEYVAYPGNRCRDGHDFLEVTGYVPEKCFVAPDRKTVIPDHYDLIRCHSISQGAIGGELYCVDEQYKKTYRFTVSEKGILTEPVLLAEEGEFGCCFDGVNLYVAEGELSVYDKDGSLQRVISLPVRPSTMAVGGTDKDLLFITAKDRVYGIRIR